MIPNSLRDAFRSLKRSPGFALLTIGILAIGLGLNAAIFTVVDCVLLRPLGYHDADRIVAIQTRFTDGNRTIASLGGGDYVDLQRDLHSIESAAYYNGGQQAVQTRGGSVMVPVSPVSPRFGEVMGVEPVAGRLFGRNDANGSEALVAASFAREHFGTTAAALGQPLHSGQGLFTIVGVLPDGFGFPSSLRQGGTTVWLELPAEPRVLDRTAYNQRAIAKLRPGVSLPQLQAELNVLSERLAQTNTGDWHKRLEAISLQERVVGTFAPTLHLLLGAVAVVLLIACVNITHLQLMRATRQMRQVAVRSALGASRASIAARALWEVVLLSIAGCAGALALAVPALKLLVHLAPDALPRLNEVTLNWHVLLASLLVSIILMSLTALLPLWRSWHVNESLVLRQDSAGASEGRGAVRVRSGFLIAQMAFTLVLACSAVLLARQLIVESRRDLGFDMQHVYTLDASIVEASQKLPAFSLDTPESKQELLTFLHSLGAVRLQRLNGTLETLRATPGIASAEAMAGAPLGFGGPDVGYAIRGRSVFVAPYAHLSHADTRVMTQGALALLHVPLLRGRALDAGDTEAAPPVLLVNQSLANHEFKGEDPIGKQVMCGLEAEPQWWTIVGVVGDIRDQPASGPTPTFYLPVAQHGTAASEMQLLVRTQPGSPITPETLRQQLAKTHPEVAVTASTMAQNLTDVERDLRFRTLLFESFAGVSILLAIVGTYGATAYSVTQRTFEFGLRMALGSTREQVLGVVLRGSAWTAAAGAMCGLVLFFLLLHVFASFTGTVQTDSTSLLLTTLGVILLTMLAATVPARRVSRIDPMRALRME